MLLTSLVWDSLLFNPLASSHEISWFGRLALIPVKLVSCDTKIIAEKCDSSWQVGAQSWVLTAHCGPDNPRIQTGVLDHSLVHSLAPLTCLLTPHYSLRSRAPLAHFTRSLACGKVNDWLFILCFSLFWTIVRPGGPVFIPVELVSCVFKLDNYRKMVDDSLVQVEWLIQSYQLCLVFRGNDYRQYRRNCPVFGFRLCVIHSGFWTKQNKTSLRSSILSVDKTKMAFTENKSDRVKISDASWRSARGFVSESSCFWWYFVEI